jgi:nucleoside-diphosphate-sugar epimerase
MKNTALIAGVTGIAGGNLAEHLVARGDFEVIGLSRHVDRLRPGVEGIVADLTDGASLARALESVKPTHVFITTWSRQATETENCRVNGAMVRNLLDAVRGKGVRHVALVTGTKHYLGPFEAYAKSKPETPFREEQPRLPYENFYYVQEDIVFEAAARDNFTWSVHRPHTLIGYAVGNVMNMPATLAAYAAIAREAGLPFVFPGSPQQFEAATDVTDARILARQLAWASTTPAAADQALNIVNGEIFRWRWLWPRLAAYFGLEAAPYPGHKQPLETMLTDAGPIWDRIAQKNNLAKNPLSTIASWWHTDADLGREVENFNDMTRSRNLGFLDYQDTLVSFTDAFDRLRADRIIP